MSDKEKRAMNMSLEELRDYAYDVVNTKVRKTPDSNYPNGVFSSTGDWKKLYEYLQELFELREEFCWIPVIYHEITEEERKIEDYPQDWVYYMDCHMPDDGDEILITLKNGRVEKDICYYDGCYSTDSGYDWMVDIKAWMPSPKGYKGAGE